MIRLTLLIAIISASIFAQNAALMPVARQNFFFDNASGQPLAGGFVYTCQAGTSCTSTMVGGVPSNPQATYTDSTATVANPNPVVLDAAGSATIWMLNLPYKIVVTNYAGVVQYSADNVQPGGPFGVVGNSNPLYVNLALQNGAVPNSPATCNDAAFTAAIAMAVQGPGFVLVPAGVWYTCSTIVIPQGVKVAGPGYWSQEPEFGTVQNAVIKAGSTFSVGSGYQSFMFVIGSVIGGTAYYGSRLEQVSVDGSGLANGEYIANAQEHSGMAFVDTLNFPKYGLYDCGADNGGPCGTNMPNGAQSDGDYHDLQFSPSDSYGMTSTTVPMYLNNLTGIREFRNITIAPFASNPSNRPLYGIVAWGLKWTLRHIHMEAIQNSGILMSPNTGAVCTAACNGTIGAVLEDISAYNFSSGSNIVSISNAPNESITLLNIEASDSSPTCWISYNLANTSTGCVTGPVQEWHIDGQGNVMGHPYAEVFNGSVAMNLGLTVKNGTSPQIALQGSGSTFGINYLQGLDSGDLLATKNIGGTGWLWQGAFSPMAMYTGNPYSGLNLMGAMEESGTLATRVHVCSNLYWDHATQLWPAGGNGGTDYACLLALNFGFGLSVNGTDAGSGSTLTTTNVLNNMAWVTDYASGHTLFGGGLVNTSTGQINDNAGTVQTPSIGDQNSGNSDFSGILTFSSSNTSNTYSFAASGSGQPVCTATGDFVNGYVYLNFGGGSHSWTVTAKSNTSNSGHAFYVCVLKP